MILSQLNPIKIHSDKRARTWDLNPESRCSELVFYPSTDISSFGNTPALSFTVSSDINSVSATIYNQKDEVEGYLNDPYIFDKTTYKQVFIIPQIHSFAVGYYYLVLLIDGEPYYSDMFGVTDNLTNLLKVKVDSADINVGGLIQSISYFSTIFYLSADYLGLKPKTEQVGQIVDGITQLLSGTSVFTHEFEIDANENIYRYVYVLGLLGGNGTIKLTYAYETHTASDILVEEIQNNYEETYQIKLSFVDKSESVQMLNSIT